MVEHYLKQELQQLLATDSRALDFLQRYAVGGLWLCDVSAPDQPWVSSGFWRALGFSAGEPPCDLVACRELVLVEDRLAFDCAVREFALTGSEDHSPHCIRFRHASGSVVWMQLHGCLLGDKNSRLLLLFCDVTGLKEVELRNEQSLRELEALYQSAQASLGESRALFELSPSAILLVDAKGSISQANSRAVELFGYSASELCGMSVDQFVPNEARHHHSAQRNDYFRNPSIRPMGNIRRGIYAVNRDGEKIPVEINLSMIDTRFGKQVMAAIHDLSEMQQLVDELRDTIEVNRDLLHQATTDVLTEISNRRYFDEVATRIFSSCRKRKSHFSLLLFDLNHFKQINDLYGHKAGDEVLQRVCRRVEKILRNDEIFARIGGDEFAILLPAANDIEANVLAERVRLCIANIDAWQEMPATVSVSAGTGVAMLSASDTFFDDVFKRADSALYAYKKSR